MTDEQVPVEYLKPIRILAEELDVPLDRLRRWSDTDRNIGFPEVAERLGRVKYYDIREVQRWYTLWSMNAYSDHSSSNGTH